MLFSLETAIRPCFPESNGLLTHELELTCRVHRLYSHGTALCKENQRVISDSATENVSDLGHKRRRGGAGQQLCDKPDDTMIEAAIESDKLPPRDDRWRGEESRDESSLAKVYGAMAEKLFGESPRNKRPSKAPRTAQADGRPT